MTEKKKPEGDQSKVILNRRNKTSAQIDYALERIAIKISKHKLILQNAEEEQQELQKLAGPSSQSSQVLSLIHNSEIGCLSATDVSTILNLPTRRVKDLFRKLICEYDYLKAYFPLGRRSTIIYQENTDKLIPKLFKLLIESKGDINLNKFLNKNVPEEHWILIRPYLEDYCKYIEPDRVIDGKHIDKNKTLTIKRKW